MEKFLHLASFSCKSFSDSYDMNDYSLDTCKKGILYFNCIIYVSVIGSESQSTSELCLNEQQTFKDGQAFALTTEHC
jgi:hypothetical protein